MLLPSGTLPEEVCGSWVDWCAKRICTRQELAAIATRDALNSSPDKFRHISFPFTRCLTFGRLPPVQSVKLLFDHTLPSPSTTISPLLYIYMFFIITSPNFRELHAVHFASHPFFPPKLTHVFRYFPPKHEVPTLRGYLSGYGVGFDLNRTDYLVMDDRLAKQKGTINLTALYQLC